MRRSMATLVLVLASLAGCRMAAPPETAASSLEWRGLESGLSYARRMNFGALFHLVRVPLDSFELFVVDARTATRRVAQASELQRESRALVVLNGTFFDERERPLGWLVSEGRELNPLRDISWWGALVVSDGEGASIRPTRSLKGLDDEARARLRLAMQVGPRTVEAGEPVKLKSQAAARSAVCVVSPRELLLIATEGAPVDANALAGYMARPVERGGLGCTGGLMLDGGPSTQLEVKDGDFTLSVKGGWGVPNALAVRARSVR